MKELTQEQAQTLLAFITSVELHTTGVWPAIERAMRDEWDIADPEQALEDAKEALQ